MSLVRWDPFSEMDNVLNRMMRRMPRFVAALRVER